MEPTDIMADFTDANVDSTMLEKMLEDFLEQLPSRILSLGTKILFCIIMFLIGRKLIKMIQKMLVKSMQRAGIEDVALVRESGTAQPCNCGGTQPADARKAG